MRYDDNNKNNRGGENYGADGQKRSDYSEQGSLPSYNDESNEIIIGGSTDDADYDEYSRRLERRASKPARRPKIEYEDDGYPSRRERKRAMRLHRAQEAEKAAANDSVYGDDTGEEIGNEIIIGAQAAGEAVRNAEETAGEALSQAETAAAHTVQRIGSISEDAAEAVHSAASHPTIERIEDSAEAAGEDIIDVIAEKAGDAKDAVSDKIEDVKDSVSDKLGDIRDAVKEKAGEIKEAVADKIEDVKEKAEDLKEAAADKIDNIKEKAEDLKEAAADTADDVRDDLSRMTARPERLPREVPSRPSAERTPSSDVGEEISEQVAAIKEEISGKAAHFKEAISEKTVSAEDAVKTAAKAAAGTAIAAAAAGKTPSRVERLDKERDILDELLGDDTDFYDEPDEDISDLPDGLLPVGPLPEERPETVAAARTGERPEYSEDDSEQYGGEDDIENGDEPEAEGEYEEGPEAEGEYEEEPEAEGEYEEGPEAEGEYEEGPEAEGEYEEEPEAEGEYEEEYEAEGEYEEEYEAEGEYEEEPEAEGEYEEEPEAEGEYEDEPEAEGEYEEEPEYEEEYEEEEPDIFSGTEDDDYDENGLPLPVVKPRDLEAVRRRREAAGEKAPASARKHELLVSASPHIHCGETTRVLMGDVIIALIPALIASVLWFGWRALMLTGVCVASCVFTEFFCRRIMKRRQTVGDLSAVVTGMLLAFCLPPELNPVFAVIGSVVAIAVVKQMFGGIGMNFANPAATARIVMMLSFPAAMTTWSRPFYYYLDAISEATPLAKLAEGSSELPTYAELLVGYHSGCIGETCAVALLLGGFYLLLRGVISWEIPVSFMGTVALFSLLAGQDPAYQLLSGGVILGAVFMATDYVTSPVNSKGRLIFGFGCGLLTMLIRLYGNMPEGVSFAILLMNILTPHIDRLTLSVPFGEEREAA